MTMEYLMENSTEREPKFYPCRMMIICKGEKQDRYLCMMAPTIFKDKEDYLAHKRKALEMQLWRNMSKIQRIAFFWKLMTESYETLSRENGSSLEIIAPYIGITECCHKGEDLLAFSFWSKVENLDDIKADETTEAFCLGCNTIKTLEKLNKCAGCKNACYCNRECQKNHWKVHKRLCKK